MTSSYALPLLPTPPSSSHATDSKSYHIPNHAQQQQQRRNGHRYNHSHSGFVLGPPSAQTNASPNRSSLLLPSLNGLYSQKNSSSGSLYTHTETSKENSPFTSPDPPVFDSQKSLEHSHRHHRSEGLEPSRVASHAAERNIFSEQAQLKLAQESSPAFGGHRAVAEDQKHEHGLDKSERYNGGPSSTHSSNEHHGHSHRHSEHHPYSHDCSSTASLHDHDHSHSRSHSHTHSYSFSLPQAMKARARGDSDLGRPASASHCHHTTGDFLTADSDSSSLGKSLLSVLVPLPYLLSSLASSISHASTTDQVEPDAGSPLLTPAQLLQHAVLNSHSASHANSITAHHAQLTDLLLQACALASGTLILSDLLWRYRSRNTRQKRDEQQRTAKVEGMHIPMGAQLHDQSYDLTKMIKTISHISCSIMLPLYAALQLGGVRVGTLMFIASFCKVGQSALLLDTEYSLATLGQRLSRHRALPMAVLLSFFVDSCGWGLTNVPAVPLICGYTALLVAILFFSSTGLNANGEVGLSSGASSAQAPQVAKVSSATIAGGVLAGVYVIGTLLSGSLPALPTLSSSILNTLVVFTAAAGFVYTPSTLAVPSAYLKQSDLSDEKSNPSGGTDLETRPGKRATRFGILVIGAFAAKSASPWSGFDLGSFVVELILTSAGCLGMRHGLPFLSKASHHQHDHTHAHSHDHGHHHHHHHGKHVHLPADEKVSSVTRFLLSRCETGSLLHSILLEKDSRRIAYFTLLNFAFMLLQGVYGYLSNSLGLLSDTVHMFFDCLGLIIGLFAAIASKWPATPDKPYGWGKLNTLAGFGNGIFLMLVSVEFVWEAIEGMLEGRELRHVQELLIVSTAGFAVNLVGLIAFGHAHHGHDHGGHDHSHGGHDHSHAAHDHHGNDHHNENMHGIFLHIAADAGGSLAVILSTALTLWKPWYLWDPLATVFIAVLIFAAAVPLVLGSARKLLLVVDGPLEWTVREAVRGLGEDVVGVAGVQGMRIWGAEGEVQGETHGHGACGHDHDHGHGYSHSHSEAHAHTHSHSHHNHEAHVHTHSNDHSLDHHHHHADSHDRSSELGHHAHAHDHKHDSAAHDHDHDHSDPSPKIILQGAIHIVATPQSNLEDVRRRVTAYSLARGLDLVVQVEREGDSDACWCGNGSSVSLDAGRRGSGFGLGSFGAAVGDSGRRGSTYDVGAYGSSGSPARGRGSALRPT